LNRVPAKPQNWKRERTEKSGINNCAEEKDKRETKSESGVVETKKEKREENKSCEVTGMHISELFGYK